MFRVRLLTILQSYSELDKQLARHREKLEEIKDDPSYSEEQKERIRERIDNAETEREVRLEVLLQNKKELGSQVSRIKDTIAKILDSDTSLTVKLRTLFREQGITTAAILTVIRMIISTIVVSLTGGGSGNAALHKEQQACGMFQRQTKALI